MERELWDAVDREGRPLGFDLVRGESLPEGAYHLVVEIYAVTHDGRVLVTQRHPDKPWGLHWEVTGGSVVKGESPLAGARRELREETGLALPPEAFTSVYVQPRRGIDGYPTIYHSFLVRFNPEDQAISLQAGETVDWRLLPYDEYKRFILTDAFTPGIRDRFLAHQPDFDRLILGAIDGK